MTCNSVNYFKLVKFEIFFILLKKMEKMIVYHAGMDAKNKACHTLGKHVKWSNLCGGNGAMPKN